MQAQPAADAAISDPQVAGGSTSADSYFSPLIKRARITTGTCSTPAAPAVGMQLPATADGMLPPLPRKRGRPRKHPLASAELLLQMQQRAAQAQAAIIETAPLTQTQSHLQHLGSVSTIALAAPDTLQASAQAHAQPQQAQRGLAAARGPAAVAAHMQAVVQRQAAAAGKPVAELWPSAQRILLEHTLLQLVKELRVTPLQPVAQAKLTAGVSYVVQSESQQLGTDGVPPLPHLVMRPPGLLEMSSPRVDALLHCLSEDAVAAAVLPLREENTMKSYLLWPQRRRQLLEQYSGTLAELSGALGVDALLQDKAFICLHYFLSEQGRLHACREELAGKEQQPAPGIAQAAEQACSALAAEPTTAAAGQRRQYSISDSNVQLGIMVRKGVGGTCPLRARARQLSGLLGALLDDPPAPPAATCQPLPATAAAVGPGPSEAMQQAPAAAAAAAAAASAKFPRPPEAAAADSLPGLQSDHSSSSSIAAAVVDALVGAVEAGEGRLQQLEALPPAEMPATPALCQSHPAAGRAALSLDGSSPAASSPGSTLGAASSAGEPDADGEGSETAAHTGLHAGGGYAAAADDMAAASCKYGAEESELEEGELVQDPPSPATVSNVDKPSSHDPGADEVPGSPPIVARQYEPQAPDDLAGEEGVEELLQEMQEQDEESTQHAANQTGTEASAAFPGASSSSSSTGSQPGRGFPSAAAAGAAAPAPAARPHSRLSLYTFSCRLELYVDQRMWSKLNSEGRNALYSAVRELERALLERFAACNLRRLQDYVSRLQASVGTASLSSPLAAALLHSCSNPDMQPMTALAPAPPSSATGGPLVLGHSMPGLAVGTSAPQQALVLVPVLVPAAAGSGLPSRPMLLPMPKQALQQANGQQRQQQQPASDQQPADGEAEAVPPSTPAARSVACAPLALHGSPAAHERSCDPGSYHSAVVLAAACTLAADALNLHTRASGLQIPWPYYNIGTRDCFNYHLVEKQATVQAGGRSFLRSEWFFRPGQLPEDYHLVISGKLQQQRQQQVGQQQAAAAIQDVMSSMLQEVEQACAPGSLDSASMTGTCNDCSSTASGLEQSGAPTAAGLMPVGCVTYTQLFSPEEIAAIEAACDAIDGKANQGVLPQSCFYRTMAKGGSAKRTKFFFGARYLWTREQLAEPSGRVAGGVRVDVPPLPRPLRELVEQPLVAADLLPPGFADSIALNMYHDGSEGLQSHFDDVARFSQPIYSLRLFSDSRLSLGTQLYGYTNGAFCIPLPRGAILVLDGYAANGLKHCVRPMDMTGKSAGLILRKINPEARRAAEALLMEQAEEWMRCLSLEHDSLRESLLLGTAASVHSCARQLPAGARREVWRVVHSMLQRVEQQCQQEQVDDITAQLVLVSAVRKVEAAMRVGLDLSQPLAAEVFSVLDDIVSWAERQEPQRRPAPPAPSPRLEQPAPLSAEQEVARCLDVMVRAVEAVDRQERLAVRQVLQAMVRCVEACAAWEDSGKQGPQPPYVPTSSAEAGKPAKPRHAVPAAPAAAGTIDFRRIALLAHVIAASLLLGHSSSAGLSADEIQAAEAAAMKQLGMRSKHALRQTLLAAAGSCAGAALAPQQQQAAVACIACALAKHCCSARGLAAKIVENLETSPC